MEINCYNVTAGVQIILSIFALKPKNYRLEGLVYYVDQIKSAQTLEFIAHALCISH